MKRRLDLALALIHDPRILFLDEPTTGLDPQSRSALWDEVGRLAREEGVTVFLTTQYLEEADVLADRVGIIDHGRIVAEGTPAQLKAEIGKPTVEVVPEQPDELDRLRELLRQFGSETAARPGGSAVQVDGTRRPDGRRPRARRARLRAAEINLHQPTLDDVFLAKTGRTLEGSEDDAEPRSRPAGRADRAALARAHVPPARRVDPAAPLPVDPDGGELERPARGDPPAGLPDAVVPRVLPAVLVPAGCALRLGDRRHRPRPRHRHRAS